MNGYSHSHPINIVEHTSRFLVLLLFPALRAFYSVLFLHRNFYAWLKGVWLDLLIVLIILFLGFLSWLCYAYRLDPDGIRVRQGVLLVKRRFIPYQNLSVLSIEHPFFLIPFGAVRVCADTDGGPPTRPDFKITLRKKELPAFLALAKAPFCDYGELKKVYLPRNIYLALLSLITSNSLSGIIYISAFLSGGGKVFGKQIQSQVLEQLSAFATSMTFGIPPIAAGLTFILLCGWLVSFLVTVIRHLFFSVTRQGCGIHIQGGLFTKREYRISVKRINLIELRQSFLTKLFGFHTAFIHANGYGKKRDELSVLMPACESLELSQNLDLLLPEFPLSRPSVRPKKRAIRRILTPPVLWIAAITLLFLDCFFQFPDFNKITVYIGLMAEIPCLWYLFVRIMSYFHTGIGKWDNTYTFCYTYGYRIKTVIVPKNRIIRIDVRQNPLQRLGKRCDVIVRTFSEGRKRHVIPNLDLADAIRVLELEPCVSQEKKPFFCNRSKKCCQCG